MEASKVGARDQYNSDLTFVNFFTILLTFVPFFSAPDWTKATWQSTSLLQREDLRVALR